MSDEMGIFEVIYNCRAMRRLKSDPVPEELLIKLVDAANQGPTGSNAQLGRWIVVRDPEQKARLAGAQQERGEHLRRSRLGQAGLPTPAAKKVLGLPDTIEPMCLIPVGYPLGKFGPVTRLPVQEVMRWDRWE